MKTYSIISVIFASVGLLLTMIFLIQLFHLVEFVESTQNVPTAISFGWPGYLPMIIGVIGIIFSIIGILKREKYKLLALMLNILLLILSFIQLSSIGIINH